MQISLIVVYIDPSLGSSDYGKFSQCHQFKNMVEAMNDWQCQNLAHIFNEHPISHRTGRNLGQFLLVVDSESDVDDWQRQIGVGAMRDLLTEKEAARGYCSHVT